VIPFRVAFEPGLPIHEQVAFAAKKAMLSGQMRPGDPFPSVRAVSTALRINPNTAHKVISQLITDGLLEVRPGIGTVVAEPRTPRRKERERLLTPEIDRLAVEARRIGASLDELRELIETRWRKLQHRTEEGGI
jgi:GntR family transcriptional regulator